MWHNFPTTQLLLDGGAWGHHEPFILMKPAPSSWLFLQIRQCILTPSTRRQCHLVLWFICKLSPQAHVFEHLVPTWQCCLGKLWNSWSLDLSGESELLQCGPWVLELSMVSRPSISLLLGSLLRYEQSTTHSWQGHCLFPPHACVASPSPAKHLPSPFNCSHQGSAHSYDVTDHQTQYFFHKDLWQRGLILLPSLNIHSTSIPRKTVPSYLCVPQDFPNCPPSSQNTDSLSTQRQLRLRTANTSLLSWRWIKPITTKSLAGRRPASIIYPHERCSLRGCSDTHVSQCRVNCSGQRSVWALLLQRPGKQL